MAGQFTQNSFVESLPRIIKLFKVFDLLKLQVSKKSDFYNQKVIGNIPFGDFVKKTRNDEITLLKSVLVPLTDAAPFWDLAPRHSCEDKYVSQYTQETCNYGLAESVETDEVVFSFQHDQFNEETLQLQKNTLTNNISNVFNIPSFTAFVFSKHSDFNYGSVVSEHIDKKDFFPNSRISDKMLDAERIEEINAHIHQDERIDNYKSAGLKIAQINLWKHCQATTNKNDRDIFKRRIQARYNYLSIDTQHGRFEMFDNSGIHVGEYYFTGILVPNSKRNHSINI